MFTWHFVDHFPSPTHTQTDTHCYEHTLTHHIHLSLRLTVSSSFIGKLILSLLSFILHLLYFTTAVSNTQKAVMDFVWRRKWNRRKFRLDHSCVELSLEQLKLSPLLEGGHWSKIILYKLINYYNLSYWNQIYTMHKNEFPGPRVERREFNSFYPIDCW